MESRIGIDTLWESYAREFLRHPDAPSGARVDAQDTEDDNETEVYVYIPVSEKDKISRFTEEFAEWMGLDRDYKPIAEDPDWGHPDEIRLEFIVSVCHMCGNGSKYL